MLFQLKFKLKKIAGRIGGYIALAMKGFR